MPKTYRPKNPSLLSAPALSLSVRPANLTIRAHRPVKALREEGYKVILVNSNPATIMTDPEMADVTYIEPIMWQTVEKNYRQGAT